jgi:hypothetical protein
LVEGEGGEKMEIYKMIWLIIRFRKGRYWSGRRILGADLDSMQTHIHLLSNSTT